MAMEQSRVVFGRDERKEKYLESIFEKANIEYLSAKTERECEYRFTCETEVKNRILCALICNFYKLKELMRFFDSAPKNGALYALIGALIGLDGEEDVKKVLKAVSSSDFVNVDGFYNFRMPELKDCWRGIGELAHRLYVQCKNTDEVYSLCIFMLGMGDNLGETIVISPSNKLYAEASRTDIAVVPYFGEEETDLIVTLLSNRPSNVVVADPSRVSDNLLSVIRALGE